MKFFWFSEEVEEIRQAAFKEGQNTGYQLGSQAMLERANQVFNSYYKLVATLVKVQNLDFGLIPALEDPHLEDYLNQVLYKVNEPYSLYQPAKEEIERLKRVIAAQEKEIKSLENRKQEAENQLMGANRFLNFAYRSAYGHSFLSSIGPAVQQTGEPAPEVGMRW